LIRAVVLDLGGVLVPWSNSATYRFIEREHGIPYETVKRELEKRLPLVQTGTLSEKEWMADLFRSQGLGPPKGYEEIWGKTFEGSTYDEDVEKIVVELKARGFRLAALSNIEPSRAAYLRRCGLPRCLDMTVFSSEVGLRKPDRSAAGSDGAIFEYTLGKMGMPASACLYVDDDEDCLKAAGRVGLKGILFRGSESLREELTRCGLLS
jgi:HAD superfamily hydrolase (TIGR01509 family)